MEIPNRISLDILFLHCHCKFKKGNTKDNLHDTKNIFNYLNIFLNYYFNCIYQSTEMFNFNKLIKMETLEDIFHSMFYYSKVKWLKIDKINCKMVCIKFYYFLISINMSYLWDIVLNKFYFHQILNYMGNFQDN